MTIFIEKQDLEQWKVVVPRSVTLNQLKSALKHHVALILVSFLILKKGMLFSLLIDSFQAVRLYIVASKLSQFSSGAIVSLVCIFSTPTTAVNIFICCAVI